MDREFKSRLFIYYNKARSKSSGLDRKRADKALGYLQSGEAQEAWKKYHTTIKWCGCPDSAIRGAVCKHRIALMIYKRIEQAQSAAEAEPVVQQPPEWQPARGVLLKLNDCVVTAEKETLGYRYHIFPDEEAFLVWVKNEKHGLVIHPANAFGRRLRPDVFHAKEYLGEEFALE